MHLVDVKLMANMEAENNLRERCEEIIGRLKDDEKTTERKPKAKFPFRLGQFSQSKQLRLQKKLPNLSNAIRSDGPELEFFEMLEKLCDEQLSISDIINQVNGADDTILHMAASFRRKVILEVIANHFPQLISRRNIKGDTVLHVAARAKLSDLIRIILDCYAKHCSATEGEEKGTLCRVKNEYGNTALHESVMMRHLEGVRVLFEEDREVTHYLNKQDKSPLYLAVENGQHDLFPILLQASFQNVEWHRGNSPLHAAILGMNRADFSWIASKFEGNIISELIYIRDQKGGIPLHCAAGIGHLGAVRKILLEDNLSALERNTKGYLPIHVACKKGRVHVVKQLVEEQEWLDPMELLNRRGQNILHVAAKNGKHEVVKYILREKMLLLNEQDKNGNTSLHLAAKNLYANVLLLLTQAKTIDLNLVNNQGLTAIDYACHRIEREMTTREFLSFAVLHSAGCRLSKMGKLFIRTKSARTEMKDHIQILMLVAILVATVTFAAGLTMPGGFNSSEDLKKRGMATLVNRGMFQVFTICDVVAMYSSTIGSSILFWGLLVDTDIAMWATWFAFHLVGIALVTMSIAFMAGVHLVVSDLHWLADVVIVIGIFFLFMLWVAYVMLIFPIGVRAPFFRHISNLIISILIPFSGRYGILADKKKKKTASEQQQKREETKDEPGQVRIDMPEESQVTS